MSSLSIDGLPPEIIQHITSTNGLSVNDRISLGSVNRSLSDAVDRLKVLTETVIQNLGRFKRTWLEAKQKRLGAASLEEVVHKALYFLHSQDAVLPKTERGHALRKAAKHGLVDVVQLLLDYRPVSSEDIGAAVWQAAKQGHRLVLRTLLRHGLISEEAGDIVRALLVHGGIPKKTRDFIIRELTGPHGHPGIVRQALAEAPLSTQARGQALVQLAGSGASFFGIAQLLNGESISDEHRGQAVVKLARWGANLNNLMQLLQDGPISEEHRGKAVVRAAQKGNLRVLEFLLANGPISDEHRGRAVELAAENQETYVIEILFASGPISKEHRSRAVESAAAHRSLALVRSHSSDISLFHDLSSSHSSAIRHDVFKQRIQVTIKRLLANGPISEESRGRAFELAAKDANIPLMQALVLNGPIPESSKEGARETAKQIGYADILENVLDQRFAFVNLERDRVNKLMQLPPDCPPRPQQEESEPEEPYFYRLEDRVPLAFLHVLLPTGFAMTEEERGRAVILAASEASPDVLKMLLANGPISEEDRGRAVLAVRSFDCLQMLLASGPISEEDRGQAALEAGHPRFVEELLAHGPIPDAVQAELHHRLNMAALVIDLNEFE